MILSQGQTKIQGRADDYGWEISLWLGIRSKLRIGKNGEVTSRVGISGDALTRIRKEGGSRLCR